LEVNGEDISEKPRVPFGKPLKERRKIEGIQ
jgi:hypothetical protein